MSEVVEFGSPPEGAQGGVNCWLCQKPTSMRALFCHNCGTIQPVRQLDHFARLGMERRIDIDAERLEKQFFTLKRTLDPNRFAIRGSGEKGHAAKHIEALDEAFETLRDPVRRGRYWMELHEQEVGQANAPHPRVAELIDELKTAAEASQCDRVAQKAGQALQNGIVNLMQSLRNRDWQQAGAMLIELDGLEGILHNIRDRRAELAVTGSGQAGIRAET